MATEESAETVAFDPLPAGTKVEVRDAFTGAWSSGFSIEASTTTGYILRRRSDNEVLPAELPHDHIRRERKSMWWV